MKLLLDWDKSELGVLRGNGLETAVFKSLKMAGRDAIRAAKAEGNRHVRARKEFKVARVNKALKTSSENPTNDIGGLSWTLRVASNLTPAIDFGARQTRQGVTVAINKGKRVLVKSGFFATMKSGHRGVFYRPEKGSKKIKEIFTTRVRDTFDDDNMVPLVFKRAQEIFEKTYRRVLPLEVAKFGG